MPLRTAVGQPEGPQDTTHLLAGARIAELAACRRSQVLGPRWGSFPPRTPDALGQHDGFQLIDGLFQTVVHLNIVVLTIILNLAAGCRQPPLDYFLRNYVFRLTPPPKAFL